MARSDYLQARDQTRQYINEAGVAHHMYYGPPNDRYWAEPLKVLAVNMEPYGYEECGQVEITPEGLIDWLRDAGNTRTRTVRYTLSVAKCLLGAHRSEEHTSELQS